MHSRLTYWLIALATVALVPYFLLCFFAMPLADDFCLAWQRIQQGSFTTAFWREYYHWSGRYTAIALALNNPFALAGLHAYQLCAACIILLTIGSNFLLAKLWLQKNADALLAALVLSLLYLFQLPVLSEGMYWYNGYSVYFLANVCFALLLFCCVQIQETIRLSIKIICFILLFLLACITPGFNESAAIICVCCLAFLAWKNFRKTNGVGLAGGLIVAMCGAAFLLASPGNAERASHASHEASLLKAFVMTHLQMLRFVLSWLSNLPVLGLGLLVMMHAERLPKRLLFSWHWLIALLYAVLFLGIFAPYFFTGILGQHRTLNFAYWFFILLVFLLCRQLSLHYALYQYLSFLKNEKTTAAIVSTAIVFMALTRNSHDVLADLQKGTLQAYRNEWLNREQLIKENLGDTTFRLPPFANRPACIFLYDENKPDLWWQEKCVLEYYRITEKIQTNNR